jgi:PBSX family phage terminase large subunit
MHLGKKQVELIRFENTKKIKNKNINGVIADGAIRSGKTVACSLAFALWAMKNFRGKNFAICGKTLTTIRRNLTDGLSKMMRDSGFIVTEKVSKNYITISYGITSNRFYLFGGRDESSQSLIQGVTLQGILFDEVCLMPESFVEQGIARCSEAGSKFFFNCNPDNPEHWFKKNFIDKATEKGLRYFHFTMDDNPSLEEDIKERYRNLFSGHFKQRFIEGKWVTTEGTVYKDWTTVPKITDEIGEDEEQMVAIDYGIINPFAALYFVKREGVWFLYDEYYHKDGGKTDWEHFENLHLNSGTDIVIDPSASSFIELLRREGFAPTKANNDVIEGISLTASALKEGKVAVCENCVNTLRELNLYSWKGGTNRDMVVKKNDHAMDALRYFVMEKLKWNGNPQSEFFCSFVCRT